MIVSRPDETPHFSFDRCAAAGGPGGGRSAGSYVRAMVPSDHVEQKAYLRLHNLAVNEMSNTVLVVKLEFNSV